jgi:hypothetical protein
MKVRASLVCLGLLVGIWSASESRAAVVLPGFDLLETITPPTNFQGFPFEGVPISSFDFGSGPVGGLGNTDTIVQRLDPANVASPPGTAPPINTELVALQLVSVTPIDFLSNGIDLYYVTLQSARGGPASTGQMQITILDATPDALDGTFNSFFDVFFDIRKGSLAGPIVYSDNLQLTSSNTPWGRVPPPGAVTIPGVNINLNGTNNAADFWPGPITELHPGGSIHAVRSATQTTVAIPEAASGAVWILIGLSAPFVVRGRRH